MTENIDMLQKSTDFRPLIRNLKKLLSIKAECIDFQPSVTIIQTASSLRRQKYESLISIPYFKSVASSCGINLNILSMPNEYSSIQVLNCIKKLNGDPNVHGIFVELADPEDGYWVALNTVVPSKDISGLNVQNCDKTNFENDESILPCTLAAILEIVKDKGIPLQSCKICLIGDENLLLPIAKSFMSFNSVVTLCKTVSEHSKVNEADVVIVAKEKFSRKDLKLGALLIECCTPVDEKSVPDDSNVVTSGMFQNLIASIIAKNVYAAARNLFNFKWNLTAIPLNFSPTEFSDIDIARAQVLKDIGALAKEIGIMPWEIEFYGDKKAKISLSVLERCKHRSPGKYVVISGITPTPLGEGKSTTTVGLCQALAVELKKNVIACLRQPSQGPTFGIKGGAAGGGFSQVVPMEDFNLHLTGDIHAVTAANNLLAAQIDTRIFHENTQSDEALYRRLVKSVKGKKQFSKIQISRLQRLGIDKLDPDTLTAEEISRFARLDIDPATITWHRVLDTNDRYLRKITVGLANTEKCMSRDTKFDIAVASEIMAVLALATDLADMKKRLGEMVVANDKRGNTVTADDLGVTGALAVLLKDAVYPNLLQTLEGAPVFVHAGPFANIAHGNSSIIADKIALKLVGKDGFVITEAGFGADVGLEKFCNIKCRYSGLIPNAAVIVATIRALKLHGGGPNIVAGMATPKEYTKENIPLVEKGYSNLAKHIEIAKKFGLPVIVALNRFSTDTELELKTVKDLAEKDGVLSCVICNHFSEGSKGAKDIAQAVVSACEAKANFRFLYDTRESLEEKIRIIATDIYGADGIEFSDSAKEKIKLFEKQGFGKLPICMSKTPLSLSHDPTKKGVPKGFIVPIQDVKLSAGAGFVYPLLGDITTMPGLPTRPCFYDIDIDTETGDIEGLS